VISTSAAAFIPRSRRPTIELSSALIPLPTGSRKSFSPSGRLWVTCSQAVVERFDVYALIGKMPCQEFLGNCATALARNKYRATRKNISCILFFLHYIRMTQIYIEPIADRTIQSIESYNPRSLLRGLCHGGLQSGKASPWVKFRVAIPAAKRFGYV